LRNRGAECICIRIDGFYCRCKAEWQQMPKTNFSSTFITMKEICTDTGCSRGGINLFIELGHFPQPVYLGDRKRVFVRDEYEQWKRDRIAGRIRDEQYEQRKSDCVAGRVLP
jgi:predicted DNA-binding transcriptional regulator AlpA